MMSRSPIALAAMLVGVALLNPVSARQTWTVDSGSSFTIEGQTSVSGFTCRVDTLQGILSLRDTYLPHGTLRIPVSEIDCGRRGMTEDLRQLLDAAGHPEIVFQLTSLRTSPVAVQGVLSIAGTPRPLQIYGSIQDLRQARVRVQGSSAVKLTDFGLTPPTKFLGLVKVQNHIDVRFDLIGARRPAASADQGQTPQ